MTELNTSCVVYPNELEKELIKNKYIPRKCRELEHLKLYHRYYTTIYGVFKVENIESIKGIEYYFIKYTLEVKSELLSLIIGFMLLHIRSLYDVRIISISF